MIRYLLTAVVLLAALPRAIQAQEPLAARVDGETITVAQWQKRLERLRAQDFVASASPLRFKTTPAGQIALDALISAVLLKQYAAKTSLTPSEAEINAEVENAKLQPAIVQALAAKTITEDDLRTELRLQRTLYNVATINQRVTPEEAKAFYERNYVLPERWQLAMIRVSTKEAADKVLAELKKGTPFPTVAAQLSEDETTRAKGGDMGLLSSTDPGLPEFIREAIKKLKSVGEVTPLLQAPSASTALSPSKAPIYVMRLAGRETPKSRPFEEVKAQVERQALFEKVGGSAAAERKLDEVRKSALITVMLPGYEDLYKK